VTCSRFCKSSNATPLCSALVHQSTLGTLGKAYQPEYQPEYSGQSDQQQQPHLPARALMVLGTEQQGVRHVASATQLCAHAHAHARSRTAGGNNRGDAISRLQTGSYRTKEDRVIHTLQTKGLNVPAGCHGHQQRYAVSSSTPGGKQQKPSMVLCDPSAARLSQCEEILHADTGIFHGCAYAVELMNLRVTHVQNALVTLVHCLREPFTACASLFDIRSTKQFVL
jgi:hypothetical protein